MASLDLSSPRPGGTGLPRVPTHFIDRPRVRAVLDAGNPIVVLHAPRGYGKSAVVTAWLRASEREALWHVVAPDETAQGFWTSLLAALSPGSVSDAQDPQNADAQTQVMTILVALQSPLVVVIDHFERLTEPAVAAPLAEIIERAAHVSLVVCTHPITDLTVLTGIGVGLDAVVIHSEALALTLGEVTALARSLGSAMPPARLAQVHEALWGWPALTRAVLTANAHQDDPASIDWCVLTRYVEHMHGLLCDDAAEFLHHTRIFTDITADLADRFVGGSGSAALLASIAQAGLARSERIGGRHVYRYIPALNKALDASGWSGTGDRAVPTDMAAAHRRAAELLHDAPWSAIGHLAAAEDWDTLTDVATRHWVDLILNHPGEMQRALTHLPEHLARSRPRLILARDVLLDSRLDSISAVPIEWPEPGVRLTDSELFNFTGLAIGHIMSLRTSFQFRAAATLANQVIDVARDVDGRWRADLVETLPFLLVETAMAHLAAGNLTQAQDNLSQCLDIGRGAALECLARTAGEHLALIDALDGDLSSARFRLDQVQGMAEVPEWMHRHVDSVAPLVETLLAIHHLDVAAAEAALATLPAVTSTERLAMVSWFVVDLTHALVRTLRGDHDGALRLLDVGRLSGARVGMESFAGQALVSASSALSIQAGNPTRARNLLNAHPEVIGFSSVLARLALCAGSTDDAVTLITRGLWRSGASTHERVNLHLVDMEIRHSLGQRDAALCALRRALDISGPDMLYPYTYADRAVLSDLSVDVDAAARVLARVEQARIGWPPASRSPLVELSEREIAVLEELEATTTIALIARRLFVSTNTVKSQLRSLYRKLGVSTRERALTEGYRLGFLGLVPEGQGPAGALRVGG